jgi:hypothetical protein
MERLAASLGMLDEVTPRFVAALDVPKGGVLLALPALLASGLLRHADKYFQLPKGFYGLKTIFLLLAFMALARLKSIEALRYHAPENGAICWASTELRKCAPCASSSSIWRTRSKPFRGARSFAKSG